MLKVKEEVNADGLFGIGVEARFFFDFREHEKW